MDRDIYSKLIAKLKTMNGKLPKNHGSFQCNVADGRADITSEDILSGTFPSDATKCFFSVVGFGTSVKQVYVCAGSSSKVTTFADSAQSITILWEEY